MINRAYPKKITSKSSKNLIIILILLFFCTISTFLFREIFLPIPNLPIAVMPYRLIHYIGINCMELRGSVTEIDIDVSYTTTRKDDCIDYRAWYENNPDLCINHSSSRSCYKMMALKTGDESLCKLGEYIPYGELPVERYLTEEDKVNAYIYDCYRVLANWRNDSSYCEKIPFESIEGLNSCIYTANRWTGTVEDLNYP